MQLNRSFLTLALLQPNICLSFGTGTTCQTAQECRCDPSDGERKHACGTVELSDSSQATPFTVLALWHRLAAEATALCDVAAQQLLAGSAQGLRH